MTGPIVTVLGPLTDGILPGLRRIAPGEDFSTTATPEAEIVVTLLPDRQELARALTGEVRWVHVLGTGVDGVPLDLMGDRAVTCSRGANAPAIAEWVLAMMLAFEKRLPESWLDAPPAGWNHADLGGLRGGTLGLIGIGSIGIEIARRALAFDMRVVVARRTDAPAPIDGVEVATDMGEVLSASDHLVVAAPATARTRHLLDDRAFAAMKPGSHLVNIARGRLVDQDALRAALDRGQVARASLDVVDPEPLPPGHWLYSHPGVRLSPHISWSSRRDQRRTLELFAEELRRYRAGDQPLSPVNVAEGY